MSSDIHSIKIIPQLSINLPKMSLGPSIVHKPMNEENGASVLRVVFADCSWVAIIMNLQIEVLTLHVWDLKLDWVDLWPYVVRVHHDVWVSLGNFFF